MLLSFHKSPIQRAFFQLASGGFISTLIALPAAAVTYGIYDARGLAMGGTAVAAGNTSQAQFYNPALLSFHDRDEDASLDGRVSFPNIVLQYSESAEAAITAADNDAADNFRDAIDDFNAVPGAVIARQGAEAGRDLAELLKEVDDEDLGLDAFFGFSISEPSKREGGAFFFGVRALAAGSATVSDEDRALIDQYVVALESRANGGPIDPALLDENGNLRNPMDDLSATGEYSALTIAEWGVALAKEFEIDGNAISFGITPKMLRVDAYRDNVDVSGSSLDGTQNFSDSKETHLTLNADFGIAAIIEEHYRVSVAIKDAIPKKFTTRQGDDPVTGEPLPDLVVELKPRARIGVAYVLENFTVGMDLDLRESSPLANELPAKELTLGMEYIAFENLALRAGYRQDQNNLRGDTFSGGIGYQWDRVFLELGYASSDELEAGSLQFGWSF